ncbi:hypothetical protein SeLEV6574_g07185 [Synchytrium endobioticum]|uniref:Uncharacterized protein n=1 Tax=Synchytrium endobioticum TaxID=286115 RepID=A0A507CLG2_9FUNG|nr:hypothetical protein SeLEV6574_g07185 [Synchytrium endobioticum]
MIEGRGTRTRARRVNTPTESPFQQQYTRYDEHTMTPPHTSQQSSARSHLPSTLLPWMAPPSNTVGGVRNDTANIMYSLPSPFVAPLVSYDQVVPNFMFSKKEPGKIAKTVDAMDKYGFLTRPEGDQESLFFQFKSAVIHRSIYGMMVLSQRQQLHLNIAQYYEQIINDDNRHRLLIPLYEHFAETDDRQRLEKLKYLEAVCRFYYRKHSTADAIKHYNLLLVQAFFTRSLRADHVLDGSSIMRINTSLRPNENINIHNVRPIDHMILHNVPSGSHG